MKFYFDTNCIRNIKRLASVSDNYSILASQLSIFEIISGIKCESEYWKRKSILSVIKANNIEIIWESPRTIMTKVFGFDISDTDVDATKIMMDKIISSHDYSKFKEIRFNLGGEDYTIETFKEYDEYFSQGTSSAINTAIPFVTKEQRKNYRELKITPQIVQVQIEMMLRDFILDQLGENATIDDPRYLRAIELYLKYNYISDYLKSITLGASRALSEGQNAGYNDGFDYGHLIYASYADYFVSDDKFYKRIPKDFLDISFITSDDYICQRGSLDK